MVAMAISCSGVEIMASTNQIKKRKFPVFLIEYIYCFPCCPKPRSNNGILAAVVDRGGFAQAASALHRSQSAISYALANLQDALGVALLEIRGRKAELTPAGRELLRRSRLVTDQFERLESLARSLQQGWESELRLVVDAAFPQESCS